MEFIAIGFLIGIIVTIAMVSILMNSKQEEETHEYHREIGLNEMLTVVNYFYHFGRATTYEKEVMEALMAKLEENMQCEKEQISEKDGEARIIRLANKLGIKIEGVR